MAFKAIIGSTIGLLATAALSGTAFAAPGDFNFTAVLAQAAGSSTSITSTQINTVDPNNYFTYQNGANTTVNNGAGIGTAIVLTNYATVAPDATAALASNYSDLISLTDIATGVTLQQTLTGSYSGGAGSNNTKLNQAYNQTSLTFTFTDGTYVVNGFGITSPGNPGSSGNGTTGASVLFTPLAGAPEPSALMLVVPGVIGMIGFARRRKSSK